MGAHSTVHINKDEKFVFGSKIKRALLGGMVAGLLLMVVGAVLFMGKSQSHTDHAPAAIEKHQTAMADQPAHHDEHTNANHEGGHHEVHGGSPIARIFAGLWFNSIFWMGIALIGVFFVAVQYVAMAGWATQLKRVPEAFGYFLPVGAVFIAVVFLFGHHDLFHWTHEGLTDPNSTHYDAILASKEWYLNLPFFIGRMIAYFIIWIALFLIIRKQSLTEDTLGGTTMYYKSIRSSVVFLVFFAVTSSMAAWDWGMSVDPHWYSTLYGWYMFASWFVSAIAVIILMVLFLKSQGYLSGVNENHLHDLGKFLFAFSIFWTYLWTAQFLLIYYANIPEETVYFLDRLDHFGSLYRPFFFLTLAINFPFPFLYLMARGQKRKTQTLWVAAAVVLIGHWFDFYLLITPGVMKGNGGFGPFEVGALVLFASLFAYIVLHFISKANLIPKNHPMLEESIHHEVV